MILKAIKGKMRKKTISENVRASRIIPVVAYSADEYAFMMDDQSIGFGFECQPLYGVNERVQGAIEHFLNQALPTNTMMQFVLFRSPDINQQIYHQMALQEQFPKDVTVESVEQRIKFLSEHTKEQLQAGTNLGTIHDLKLLVTVKMPTQSKKPSQVEIDQLKNLRDQMQQLLQASGLGPQPLTADGYVRTMSTMLNWGEGAAWRTDACNWEADKPIGEQVFDHETDLEVNKEGLRLGDYHVKVMSAKKVPDAFYFGDALAFIGDITGKNRGIQENYMVVMNVLFPDQNKAANAINRDRAITSSYTNIPLLKNVPSLTSRKSDLDAIYNSMASGANLVKISHSLVLFSPTSERAQAAATAARNIWREYRFEMMEDKFIALPMLINCLPFCTDLKAIKGLFRYKTMTTEQASVLLPIFGEWKGTGTFHSALISRNGQLMSLSPQDSDTNKNFIVAAEAGSGRGFFLNELIMGHLYAGAQVWVINADNSFNRLSDTLKGTVYQCTNDAPYSFNPFKNISDWHSQSDGAITIVQAMVSKESALDDYQQASLWQIMNQIWEEKGNDMTVDDIADRCSGGSDQRIRDMGHLLFPFTSKGNYGSYVSGSNSVSLQNRFTVLECGELYSDKHLRQVVLLQMIYQVQQEMFHGETLCKKILLIDLPKELLEECEPILEGISRRARMLGAGVGICTQSISDLFESRVGRAIAENSSSMYLLRQTADTIEAVKRNGFLSLSEGSYNALKTVHTKRGAYAEIFIKTQHGCSVGRLVVSDFQKMLYSSDPTDVSHIKELEEKGMATTDAVLQLIDKQRIYA
ncbi:TraC family protein [Vibrio parahaemolyticus]|uniref:TraC family protein n=1 Tax=Vibrio parahaemolyticus TaxID=670 RepID=UPI00215315EB|nr:TraC family protein [Vibrio parahaemolyticus]